MVSVVCALADGERVHINVLDAAHERHVAALLAGLAPARAVTLHCFPTNDAWCRDHGAIFVTDARKTEPMIALDFDYNAWGEKYPPYVLDQAIPESMATALSVPLFAPGMILEGGSIDVNGAGALLTTEECLLNENRNPLLDRAEIEARLQYALGVRQIIWLGEGIVGGDTDGHIDELTRFVAQDVVVTVIETDAGDPNYRRLLANRERLVGVRLDDGRKLQVLDLPMPAPLIVNGRRLPASYANFYLANNVVLIPAFGCDQDLRAQEVLRECFPDRRIVPVDSRDLAIGLGALHCLTQQVPSR